MIGQWLVQVIPKKPPHAQPICRMAHQLPFGTYSFKEHHELKLEKHDGVNGGTAFARIGLLYEFAHKREVKHPLQVTIKVILWD